MKIIDIKNSLMKRKLIVTSTLLVLFLVIGSSFAGAVTGSSEKDSFIIQHENLTDVHIGGSSLGSSYNVNTNFPTSYDLRTLNKVTPVKDQGSTGACWTFATYGSLESSLLPGESWNFSENHMKNLLSPAAPEGFDSGINNINGYTGGNFLMATAYLARWSGPINASDDPYSASSVYSPTELNLPVQKHVQDVYFLPARTGPLDNNEIKSAIMKYGAVTTSIYENNATFFAVNNTTILEGYNSTTYSYYYNGSANSTHGADIVGWDDNFDKNKFSPVPPGNGAFIVRNSWGKEFGENGYFYVSYYDSDIGKDNAVFTAENTNNYQNIYQYDPFGWTGNVTGLISNPSTGWCANIFTAKSNEILKAISFYATNSSCNYELYIYTNPESGPTNQAGSILTQSGTLAPGYHTVRLNSGVKLQAGQKFSVVLKLTTPDSHYPIALEDPFPGYSSKATAYSGESFVSPDGTNWVDITTKYPNTNVCIKAFTDSGSGLPVANFNSDVTSGYAPLTVKFTDSSLNATGWAWDFGDGNNSNEQSPDHTYSTAGNYTVTLTASNANGTDSKLSTITVIAKTSQSLPVADFSSDVTSGQAPLSVRFTDNSQNATSRVWDFGDETPTSTDKNPEHTYNEVGTYTVTLTVSNEAGSATKTGLITVGSGSIGPIDNGKTSTNNGTTTTNTNTTSANNETNVTDNGTTTNDNGTTTNDNGTTTNDNGTTCTDAVKPRSNLVADFSTCTGNVPLKMRFIDKSTGDPVSWNWDFGDGRTSTCKNSSHIYSKAGKYTVTLTIKDAEGNTAKKCKCITVSEPPRKECTKNTKKVSKDTKKVCKKT